MTFHPAVNGACESFQRHLRADRGELTDPCRRCDRPRGDHPHESDVEVAPSTDARLTEIERRLAEVERELRVHGRSIDFRVGGGS